MQKNIFNPNPFTTFYVVTAYILVFSLWWGYLLYAKNETAYKENIELKQITFQQQQPGEDFFGTEEYDKLQRKYFRQKIMILSEGAVFLLLLLVGFARVRKVFKQEMALASQQRNFLLSITHELKSPLSTVKVSLQTLFKRKLDEQRTSKLIQNSLLDLYRLETLVDNILFATKIERAEHGLAASSVNVSEIVTRVTEKFSENKKNIAVTSEIAPEVYLNTDAIGFTSLAINLIENAVKYSPENSKVNVHLSNKDNGVLLKISDNGIGIPDEEKENVFEKFYRIGNENTRTTKGTGLGLYIVKRFVEIYNGTIQIENNKPNGTVFIIFFPLNNKTIS